MTRPHLDTFYRSERSPQVLLEPRMSPHLPCDYDWEPQIILVGLKVPLGNYFPWELFSSSLPTEAERL